jgi:heparinase II/III-like protein
LRQAAAKDEPMPLLHLLTALACVAGCATVLRTPHTVMPGGRYADRLAGNQKAVTPVLDMTEAEMLALIPTQSGLYFVGCVHCQAGQQEGQLKVWNVSAPDVVRCEFCGHAYPSETHPMDEALEVVTPSGQTHTYPYYASSPTWWRGDEPHRSYFSARVDYHKIRYMEDIARRFARIYASNGDRSCARRAALILHRFAQVFPGYCYHYDFPFQQKVIYAGDVSPHDFRAGFRTARWTWWAYLDISSRLLEAYELIAGSDQLERLAAQTDAPVVADIERMFVSMADQIMGNQDPLSNMSPRMWASLVLTGRILERPAYVHAAMGRLRRMVSEQFFADGSWQEGAPSYHSQVMGGLSAVMDAARGYSDPPGYTDPHTGERFDSLDVDQGLPAVARARQALLDMRLPDGRYAPVHDTWWTNASTAPDASGPVLLPALGHGILARGAGDEQTQVHLTWSPGYGHIHYDGLSLLLFATGGELLSDIGYTHTRWREWTVTSAAHNLVVVDGANQLADQGTHGHLRFFDGSNDRCQVLSVDNPQVYPGVTDTYRRTVALAALSDVNSYLVDIFQVEGGQQHDYFLHGSADESQELEASADGSPVSLAPRQTLVPEGVEFFPGQTEQANNCRQPGFAYGYLSNLRQARFGETQVVQLDFRADDGSRGLRAWYVARAGDELVLGSNPAIRQARSDDGKLDQYHRAFAMLRRQGGSSRSVSIIEPHGGTPLIQSVRVIDMPGAALALEVTTDQRRDLILVDADRAHGRWLDRPLTATTELAILQATDATQATETIQATVVAGSLSWGEFGIRTEAVAEHELLAVARDSSGGSLLVEGELLPPGGTIITLDHAGQRTSAREITCATVEGGNSRMLLADDPGFEFDAASQTSRFVCLPLTHHTGRHVVRLYPVGHAGSTERAGG